MMDKEYSGTYLTRNPILYQQGIKGFLFKKRVFWGWIIMGTLQSAILTIILINTIENVILNPFNNVMSNLMVTGMVIYGATILNTNLKIFIFSNIFTPLSVFLIVGSVLFFISNYAIESTVFLSTDVYYSFMG